MDFPCEFLILTFVKINSFLISHLHFFQADTTLTFD